MATKKTNSKAPVKQQKRSTPSISARIDRLVDYENSKVKAMSRRSALTVITFSPMRNTPWYSSMPVRKSPPSTSP